jgi:hypothetical protein
MPKIKEIRNAIADYEEFGHIHMGELCTGVDDVEYKWLRILLDEINKKDRELFEANVIFPKRGAIDLLRS